MYHGKIGLDVQVTLDSETNTKKKKKRKKTGNSFENQMVHAFHSSEKFLTKMEILRLFSMHNKLAHRNNVV